MVAVVLQRIHLWLLSVIGIFVIITITCSGASSMLKSLDKVKLINGSSSNNGLSSEQQYNDNSNAAANATAFLARLEKPSFQCEGKPDSECDREYNEVARQKPNRSKSVEKVAAAQDNQLYTINTSKKKVNRRKSRFKSRNSTSLSNSGYLPVKYGPYGYEDNVPQGRGWITVPLFIIFSIIQFKLVSAIFLAFFGPMILFLLIVQGFLFKATLILMGLMMT